jgi:membrane associated rhomboid family serine protease
MEWTQGRAQVSMFIILPVGVDYGARRYPVVTLTLIGINVLVFLASLVYVINGGIDAKIAFHTHFWLIPALGYLHTYITTWFVHAGIFHLIGNMIYLYLFGSCVEDMIGRWQFILFYTVGGLVADFGYIATAPGHFSSEIPLGGASGAITACIAGYLVLVRKGNINLRYFIWFLRPYTNDFWLPGWLVVTFWFLQDLVALVVNLSAGLHHPSPVAYGAHVGGFLGGLGLAYVFKRINRGEHFEDAREKRQVVVAAPREIYFHENGAQIGPFTVAQARQMIQLGSIGAEALYWKEGMPEWRPAAELIY